ncbi:hypothetical protein ESCO_000891 [Escovopsis weberi]|uniref:SET domain-containing protein n=1 Tax=Escovopsis weberi TaxID=150374 RepID=A0A0M8MYB5_ESCWE|nr:hypothetical protein ESCO_000891 [Escovopsis weberi]
MVDYVQPETYLPEKERLLSIAAPSSISHDEKLQQQTSGNQLRNWDALEIQAAGVCGNGVFAKFDFERGHKIIVERPILSCIHWMLRNGLRTVSQDWMTLPLENQQQMTSYFSRLKDVPIGGKTLLPQHKKVLEKFIEEYGFWDPQRARAHIYLLVSHINHACISCANAEQWTDSSYPHRITVKLVKPVKAGQEIFINYNRKTPFGCALCGPLSFRDRVKAFGCGIFK